MSEAENPLLDIIMNVFVPTKLGFMAVIKRLAQEKNIKLITFDCPLL